MVREELGEERKTRYACFLRTVALCEYARDHLSLDVRDVKMMNLASGRGYLVTCRWLRAQGCEWNPKTIRAAAENGHLEVIKWARRHTGTPESESEPCEWNAGCCQSASRGGHIHVLEWVRSQEPPCNWGTFTATTASEKGHIHVLSCRGCVLRTLLALSTSKHFTLLVEKVT